MNPKFMDEDGLFSGREVSQGEIIGKVATWGDYPNGTSYHLHFNMQVFSKIGWVWVNPYMSLVRAYEKLIGARGTELKPGDLVPPAPDKPPSITQASPTPGATAPLPEIKEVQKTEESTVERHKPHKRRHLHKRARRHHHHYRHRYYR
jgi:murein DD-endopeptidase MepM/ murein hydrolase activator NlpD